MPLILSNIAMLQAGMMANDMAGRSHLYEPGPMTGQVIGANPFKS